MKNDMTFSSSGGAFVFFPTSQSSVVEVASSYMSVVSLPVGSAGMVPTVMQAYSK